MTRKAVVTQAQIERGLRAARAAMPEQTWRIRITPAEVTIEPAEDHQEQPRNRQVDEDDEIIL